MIAANTLATLRDDHCSAPETACFVCQVRAVAAATPATSQHEFPTGELVYNIVGIRRRDSVDNKFDDFMVVFTRLVSGENAKQFEKRVEKDLIDDWKQVFAAAKGSFRLAPCSRDQALYAVGFFDQVTTDPGWDKSYTKLWSRVAALRKKIADAEARQLKLDSAAKTAADAQTTADAKAKSAPKNKDLQRDAQRKLKAATVAADNAKAKKDKTADDKSDLAKLEKEVAAEDHGAGAAGKGDKRGKGMIPCAVYASDFRIGIHHFSAPDVYGRGHVAYTICNPVTNGLRFFRGDFLIHPAKRKTLETNLVLEHIPSGGAARLFVPPASLAVDAQTHPNAVTIAAGTESIPVAADDVVVLQNTVAGTNLHRGHNFALAAPPPAAGERGHVIPGSAPQGVFDFSEGCQTYHQFAPYNAFLRLGQMVKAFACQSNGKPACAFILSGGGEARSSGEQALVDERGELFMTEATLCRDGDGDDAKTLQQKAEARDKAKVAWQKIDKTNAHAKHKLSEDELEKKHADEWKKYQDAEKDLNDALDAQDTNTPEFQQKKLAFVRERAQMLGADFLRACDARIHCPQRFTYVLADLDGAGCDALPKRFAEAPNVTWDGDLVLGGA